MGACGVTTGTWRNATPTRSANRAPSERQCFMGYMVPAGAWTVTHPPGSVARIFASYMAPRITEGSL